MTLSRRTFTRFCGDRGGFALTASLIILTLLTIILVAYLSAVRTDRATASAYTDIQRVNLLAEGAVEVALGRTVEALSGDPYHAEAYSRTAISSANGDPVELILPVVVRKPATAQSGMSQIYLVSTPDAARFPENLSLEDLADLDPDLQLGLRLSGSYLHRAPWINVRRDPSSPAHPARNPVVARFAFWVDDETSRIDYGIVGNDNASGGFLRGEGTSPSDIDLGALPLIDYEPLTGDTAALQLNQAIVSERFALPYIEPKFLNRVTPGSGQKLEEVIRFYGTVFSFSNELSGVGTRRLNLNAVVEDTDDTDKIRSQVQEIEQAVTKAIPTFGRRFYPALAGGTDSEVGGPSAIYVSKIAANIRDYVDRDSQPTIIDAQGQFLTGPVTGDDWPGDAPPVSVGKETMPYLTEYAWMVRELFWQRTGGTASYRIALDQYLEFSNPTAKDVRLPPGAQLTVTRRPEWDTGNGSRVSPPDLTLDLSGVIIPAGQVVVVTTDPKPKEIPEGLLQPGTVPIICPVDDSKRIFDGTTSEKEGERLVLRPIDAGPSSPVAHWQSSVGTYGLFNKLSLGNSAHPPFMIDGSHLDDPGVHHLYAAALTGNVPATVRDRSGDPRSLHEPLRYQPFVSPERAALANPFRYTASLGEIPGDSTFGRMASPLIETTRWPDPTPRPADSAESAPAFVADQPMTSIGQLGDIYDPARESDDKIEYAFGGGRTLAVGQPEAGAAAKFSPEWMRKAWRLTDIFEAGPNEVKFMPATMRGKINLNSIVRDDGVALRGVLRQLAFGQAPRTAKTLDGYALTPADTDEFIASVENYIDQQGAFMERGELSEISFFARENRLANGVTGTSVPDRTREELFRRIVGLVTTRSASFTIHAVAETVRQSPDGSLTTRSRAKRSIVYRFEPIIGPNGGDIVQGFRAIPLFAYPNF